MYFFVDMPGLRSSSWRRPKSHDRRSRWTFKYGTQTWYKSKYGMALRLFPHSTSQRCIPKQLPSRHLLGQIQQWKLQDNMWNLFKVNNKDIRTTPFSYLIYPLKSSEKLWLTLFPYWLWTREWRLDYLITLQSVENNWN